MRFIEQKGDMECGVACVSMLTGVKYKEAKQKLMQITKGKLDKNGCSTSEICRALEHFGCATVGRRVRPLGNRDYKTFDFYALLKKQRASDPPDRWHWMIWNPVTRDVFDPQDLERHHGVTGYVEVAYARGS